HCTRNTDSVEDAALCGARIAPSSPCKEREWMHLGLSRFCTPAGRVRRSGISVKMAEPRKECASGALWPPRMSHPVSYQSCAVRLDLMPVVPLWGAGGEVAYGDTSLLVLHRALHSGCNNKDTRDTKEGTRGRMEHGWRGWDGRGRVR